ncbi:MAG TPA: DUF2271 domain-containing protein [Burkholderiaceae bacterium]|jgi:hypothetical protein
MHLRYSITLGTVAALGSAPLLAAELQLKIELPRLAVAEYHRPYVAMWLEKPDQSVAANLAVWYDLKKRNDEGAKWLKELRTWWRKAGRDMTLPADGLTSATHPAGEQSVSFPAAKAALDKLPAGDYVLAVEAARESGGREVVRVPFAWPPKAATTTSAKGENELGAVSVTVTP